MSDGSDDFDAIDAKADAEKHEYLADVRDALRGVDDLHVLAHLLRQALDAGIIIRSTPGAEELWAVIQDAYHETRKWDCRPIVGGI